jgi:REP element-mobilizing transposase RayT
MAESYAGEGDIVNCDQVFSKMDNGLISVDARSRTNRDAAYSRASAANLCYHVLNRGNNRASFFHKDGDFNAFVDLLAEAKLRNPMRILAYCVLPNHFHRALWPLGDRDLGRWMHWFLTAHVRRYEQHYHSTGHVWQRRFKASWVGASAALRRSFRGRSGYVAATVTTVMDQAG